LALNYLKGNLLGKTQYRYLDYGRRRCIHAVGVNGTCVVAGEEWWPLCLIALIYLFNSRAVLPLDIRVAP